MQEAKKKTGYEFYDSGGGGPGTVTGKLRSHRGKVNAASIKDAKMHGVPMGDDIGDFFDKHSYAHVLLSEGQVMIHSHRNVEYWTHADQNMKPIVGKLEQGQYFSTLVLIGQSGQLTGRNHNSVR